MGAPSAFAILHKLRRFFSNIVVRYFSVAVEKKKFPAAPFRIQSCPTVPLSGYSPIHTGATTVPEIRFLNFLLLTSSFKNFRPHCQQLKTGTCRQRLLGPIQELFKKSSNYVDILINIVMFPYNHALLR